MPSLAGAFHTSTDTGLAGTAQPGIVRIVKNEHRRTADRSSPYANRALTRKVGRKGQDVARRSSPGGPSRWLRTMVAKASRTPLRRKRGSAVPTVQPDVSEIPQAQSTKAEDRGKGLSMRAGLRILFLLSAEQEPACSDWLAEV